MPPARFRRKQPSDWQRASTWIWVFLFGISCLLALNTFWMSFVNRVASSLPLDFLILFSPIFFGFALMAQLRRTAYAYLEGKPRPRVVKRTPRPIRSETEAQVRPGRGFRGTLRKIATRVPAYQKLTRHHLD